MKIVVVGGGTSGWIVTHYLSSTHNCINISTEEIPTIGVGEGTTGKFPDMIDVDKTELMIELDALPKLGIKFNGWSKTRDYFWSPIDGSATANYYIDYSIFSQYFTGYEPLTCSQYTVLMENGLTNYSLQDDYLVGNWDHHALHIDAYKTAEYFKKISLDSSAVHIEAKVVKVNREHNAITSLELDNGSTIRGINIIREYKFTI